MPDMGDEVGEDLFSWFRDIGKRLMEKLGRGAFGVGFGLAVGGLVGAGLLAGGFLRSTAHGPIGRGIGGLGLWVAHKAGDGAADLSARAANVPVLGAMFGKLAEKAGSAGVKGVQTLEIEVAGETPEERKANWSNITARAKETLREAGVPDGKYGFSDLEDLDDGKEPNGWVAFDGEHKEQVVAAMAAAREDPVPDAESLSVELGLDPDFEPDFDLDAPATDEQLAKVDTLSRIGAISKGASGGAGERAKWTGAKVKSLMEGARARVKLPWAGFDASKIAKCAAALRDEWAKNGLEDVEIDFDEEKRLLVVKSQSVGSLEKAVASCEKLGQTAVEEVERLGRPVTKAQVDWLKTLVEEKKEISPEEIEALGPRDTWTIGSVNELLNRHKAASGEVDLKGRGKRGGMESLESKAKRAEKASGDVAAGKTADPKRGAAGHEASSRPHDTTRSGGRER